MSLHDRLSEDLKRAMKDRDQLRMDVIRMMKAAILNKELELKKELDDADMSRVMTTLVKQRRESVEQYQKANRADLASKELKEIDIIQHYLPEALSQADLLRLVETAIQETSAKGLKDMGAVMKAVMPKLIGQTVDGKHLSDLVKAKLQ
ncbi:MAG TPA: GatB/YqeY domain-containing protein [Nitrospiraceae bacterium]|nr:GatB/YqeY domain-containing protein [Nitrospiraceae bacterium]